MAQSLQPRIDDEGYFLRVVAFGYGAPRDDGAFLVGELAVGDGSIYQLFEFVGKHKMT
ncbi:MAG: hypothetical protein IKR63_06990 [Alloprevotella sp.]|nr:hypothetical protein [Alloprevotella sp.]